MKWSGGLISIGSFAVNFFFVISGFLIVKSFESSSSLTDYFKKRVLRIYPGFIVAFALSIFLFGALGHIGTNNIHSYTGFLRYVPALRELANMLSLQSPVESLYFTNLPQSGLNNSLWTIQYEFICYLMVPFFGFLGVLQKKQWVLGLFILFYTLLICQTLGWVFQFNNNLNGGIIGNPYYYPRFFTYFFAGACFYLFRNTLPSLKWLAVVCLAAVIIAFRLKLVDFILPVAGSYLLFYLAYNAALQFPNFSRHGDFSYGIYLYGWPIQQLVMLYFWQYLTPKTFFLLVFPIVLFFAWLSWKFIEGPALRLKKSPLKLFA